MKTCKDCIYWIDINHPSAAPIDGSRALHIGQGECRLYPEPRYAVFANHWCGQLKEKVTEKFRTLEPPKWTRQRFDALWSGEIPQPKDKSWKDKP